jgi:hypothetical protein
MKRGTVRKTEKLKNGMLEPSFIFVQSKRSTDDVGVRESISFEKVDWMHFDDDGETRPQHTVVQ